MTRCLVLTVLLFSAASISAQSITNPIVALKNHITGVAPLTAAQIVTQGNLIQSSIRQVGTNDVALAAALDLVATFDASANKALFTSGSTTYGGFTRDGAGDELAQALFDLQQGILDYTYNNNSANLTTYNSLLNNTKFGTSTYFPGAVTQPVTPRQGYEVQINATHPEEWGMPNLYVTYAARRPTGCYLAPGSIAAVTVPAAYASKGWLIRVGCHYWDFSAKSTLKRLDRVSMTYQVTSPTTLIANPLGGNIYIEVPYLQTNGIVTLGITNVVRSPFFRNTVVHQTTPVEWLAERTNPGAWADFESDRFMMQVPRKWIYAYTNANTVMTNWDKSVDAVSDMLGRPHLQSKTVLYIQPDVLIRSTANEPGYPQVNEGEIYNPNTVETGNKDHYLLNGPQTASWTTFHEMGHGQSFSKFSGETESAVNLLHVAVKCQAFGWTLTAAFSESVADWPNMTLKDAALSWFLPGNFVKNYTMSDTEMKYQHRGHGKYVEVVNLFGWNTLSNFWYSQNVDYENGVSISVNEDPTDGRILRMSKASGVDMTPLFHMWGMKPVSATTLKANIAAAGLMPSLAIYNRLQYYQSIVPLTLTQFRQNYNIAKGVVGEPDKSWYTNMYYNYTADIGYASIAQLQNIIDLYFPNGPPGNRWTGAISGVWDSSTLNWTDVTGSPTNYVDGNPGDAVLFDDTLTANPAIILNTTIKPSAVTFSNNATTYTISGTGKATGNLDLIKNGTGTATINTSNAFTGSVTVNSGALVFNGANSCGNVTVNFGTLTFNNSNNFSGDATVNSGTLVLNGVNVYGDTTLSSNAVVRAGNSRALGTGTITLSGAQTDGCRVELIGGITVTNALSLRSRNYPLGYPAHVLNVSGTNTLDPTGDLVLATGGNVLSLQSDSGLLVLTKGMTNTASAPRYLALLGAGNGEVRGPISANGGLAKLGTGTWTLTGSSPLNGPTVVSNGTLMVNGSLTSAANIVTIAIGTLAGNGTIAGAVTVQAAGTLAAGAFPGRLTISNTLTLQGQAVMEIARNGGVLTNDLVAGITTLTYGGTLVVTNVGSSPLQVGDSFQLFAANSRAGTFANILYPSGYTFSNSLAVNGQITVLTVPSITPPNFTPNAVGLLPDGSISLNASGTVGTAYRLWASPDGSLMPIASTWTLLTNGSISVSPFTIIDNTATNFPQRFYLFSAP